MIVFLLHFGRYNLCTRRRFKNHKFIEYAKGEEVPDAGKRQVFSGDVYIEDGYIVSYKEMKGKPVRKV